MKRNWTDAPAYDRCKKIIRLSDGSKADCGRKVRQGSQFCWQHQPAGIGTRTTKKEKERCKTVPLNERC